jgi:glycosyltransferase involved in cell wall biosynthesis
MRICHVITRLILGGAQENTVGTVCGLAARGHSVTLITGPSPGPEGTLLEYYPELQRAAPFRLIVEPHLVRPLHPWHDARAWQALRTHFLRTRYDIIHTHSSKAGIVGRMAARAARTRGTRVVHTIHGLAFDRYQPALHNALYIRAERWCAQHTDRLISVCDAMTAQALAAGVGQPGQYTTIYSGMDVTAFRAARAVTDMRTRLGIPAGAVVFLSISRLFAMKGLEDILETVRAAQVHAPNSVFALFVGDGPLRLPLMHAAAQAGLTGCVHFAGRVAPTAIAHWVAAADVVVHASLREGLARAVVQGLAGGKPVVTYDVGGAREVVRDGVNGFVVPAGDRALLQQRAWQLVRDAELRAALARGAAVTDLSRFEADHMVAEIEKLYSAI